MVLDWDSGLVLDADDEHFLFTRVLGLEIAVVLLCGMLTMLLGLLVGRQLRKRA